MSAEHVASGNPTVCAQAGARRAWHRKTAPAQDCISIRADVVPRARGMAGRTRVRCLICGHWSVLFRRNCGAITGVIVMRCREVSSLAQLRGKTARYGSRRQPSRGIFQLCQSQPEPECGQGASGPAPAIPSAAGHRSWSFLRPQIPHHRFMRTGRRTE